MSRLKQPRGIYRRQARDAIRQDESIEHYFVPSFSIRRSAAANDDLKPFLKQIKRELGTQYYVFKPDELSLTIIEKMKMVRRLREAGAHPEPGFMSRLSAAVADSIGRNLAETPRGMDLPLGRVDRFGDDGRKNKLGFIPLGWRGFNARYAAIDSEDQRLPLSLLVDESALALGMLVSAFNKNDRLTYDGLARTPHITFAEKTKGPIHDGELRDVSSSIEDIAAEFMPSMTLEDPVIYLRTSQHQGEAQRIAVR